MLRRGGNWIGGASGIDARLFRGSDLLGVDALLLLHALAGALALNSGAEGVMPLLAELLPARWRLNPTAVCSIFMQETLSMQFRLLNGFE